MITYKKTMKHHSAVPGKVLAAILTAASLSLTACGGSTPTQSMAAEPTAAETTSAAPAAQETTAAPETTAIRETAAAPAESAAETASETAAVPEETVALDTLTPDPAYDFWNGDWFGWWEATDPQGDWVQLKDLKIALLCQIRIAKNGRGVLMLWDNNLPRTNAICEINLTVDKDKGAHGVATSGEGYFISSDVLEGDWVIDPEQSGHDGMIRIDGTCIEEGEKQFDYHVYLMKWGADWSAVDEIDQPPLMEWYNVYRDNGFEMPHELP